MDNRYQESRERLISSLTDDPRDSDEYFHEVEYDCTGRHCVKKRDLSHEDVRGAFWSLVNQGVIEFSFDGMISKGEYYGHMGE